MSSLYAALAAAVLLGSLSLPFYGYWWATFALFAIFRYARLLVAFCAYWTFKPRPMARTPRFTASDVSVVVPTKFSVPAEHIACLKNILSARPRQVIVVTAKSKLDEIKGHLTEAKIIDQCIVTDVERFDKRQQMIIALTDHVTGPIVAFADDDVQWPQTDFIPRMLACFEDDRVGAAGPGQRVQRNSNTWGFSGLVNFLGICYLERRNFNTMASNHLDGAVSTLSGRTSFYRTSIIQNNQFYDYFMASHTDDKNLTRWTFNQGWNIALQCDPKALIVTTLENDWSGFLNQATRWARGHWSGNYLVMSTTDYWWNRHVISLYLVYIAQFQSPAFVVDGFLLYSLNKAMAGAEAKAYALGYLCAWILFTKVVKIVPHFCRNPLDLCWVLPMIGFSYFHGLINIYGLITLNISSWGAKTTDAKPQETTEQSPIVTDTTTNTVN